MLYQLHEMQRSFLTPLMQWADASSKLFSNPVSPFAHTPFSQRIAAGYAINRVMTRRRPVTSIA